MNAALSVGCALAGGLAGPVLDLAAARVPPASDPIDALASAEAATDGPLGPGEATGSGGTETVETPPGRPAPAAPVPDPPTALELVGASLLTAVLFAAAAIRFGPVPELAAYCVLFAGLVAVSIADLRVSLVPRTLLYPTLGLMTVALVAASAVGDDWSALGRAAIGGAGAFVVFFALWWFVPRGIGFGDVRLVGVMGVGLGWLGFADIYVGFLSGFVLGAIMGTVKMLSQGTGRKTRFPFAPALSAGTVVGVLWGAWVANYWVLHT